MPTALNERQVLVVVNFRRQGELLNLFRQQVREVWYFDLFGDLGLRLLSSVNHMRLVLDKRPLETSLRSVDIKALAILSSHVVKESPDMRRQVAVFDFDMAGLNSELIARLLGDVLTNCSRTKATDVLG